jgi:pantoate--beta-alanine ligase
MEIARTVLEMREKRGVMLRRRWANLGRTPIVGLVPTMGALHGGHESLLGYMAQECDVRLASVFVNPRQFAPGEDLGRYPRALDKDLQMCQQAGVDVVFVPEDGELYGENFQTTVSAGQLGSRWEGEGRAGHFDGVATIVAKLLNVCGPNVAYFGEKDFQQLRIVEQLALDLNFDVYILPCNTVREPDGLAMSSRNAYLSPEQRQFAPKLYQALQTVNAAFADGERSAQVLVARGGHVLTGWEQNDLNVEYFTVVDPQTLEPRETAQPGDRALIAVRLGETRLIDNIELHEGM